MLTTWSCCSKSHLCNTQNTSAINSCPPEKFALRCGFLAQPSWLSATFQSLLSKAALHSKGPVSELCLLATAFNTAQLELLFCFWLLLEHFLVLKDLTFHKHSCWYKCWRSAEYCDWDFQTCGGLGAYFLMFFRKRGQFCRQHLTRMLSGMLRTDLCEYAYIPTHHMAWGKMCRVCAKIMQRFLFSFCKKENLRKELVIGVDKHSPGIEKKCTEAFRFGFYLVVMIQVLVLKAELKNVICPYCIMS